MTIKTLFSGPILSLNVQKKGLRPWRYLKVICAYHFCSGAQAQLTFDYVQEVQKEITETFRSAEKTKREKR